jgi:bifunctional non-homologous end joining protein LigD
LLQPRHNGIERHRQQNSNAHEQRQLVELDEDPYEGDSTENFENCPPRNLDDGPAVRVIWHFLCTKHSMPRAQPSPSERVEVGGISISHPDRSMFPAAGLTKLDLARYYEAIANWILPHLADRPLTLVRCPNGTGVSGAKKATDCYYMRHSKVWSPPAVRRVRIREKTKIGEYLIADSLPALVGLVQMDVLEIHTWNSRFEQLEQPDRIVIDLDPGEHVEWTAVVAAARAVRVLLESLDLESFVKTTGGRGLHIVVPLTPRADWTECLGFARAVAAVLVRQQPDRFTERFAKLGREDKILVDYLRNNRTNTSIAAYSTRARQEATVSVPLAWSELTAGRLPTRFTVPTVAARLGRLRTDPWKDYAKRKQTIPRRGIEALDRLALSALGA